MRAASVSGVPASPSTPAAAMRRSTARVPTAPTAAAFSAATAAAGVPAGAMTQPQLVAAASGQPASPTVGTSGSSGRRRGPVTASARTCPSRICPAAPAIWTSITWRAPAIGSFTAAPLPRQGTCSISIPAASRDSSDAVRVEAPWPEEPKESASGRARAWSTNSRRPATGRPFGTTITMSLV
jgi:hypothetical protein